MKAKSIFLLAIILLSFDACRDKEEEDPITPVNGQITIPAGYFNFARELVEMQSVNPVEPTGKNDIYISAV